MPYFDAESLRPAIRAILAGADQSQITARQVRKMLLQNDSSLNEHVLNHHKEEINHITKSVFEALTALSPSPSPSPSPPPKPSSSSKPHSNSHHSFPQHQPSASTSTSTSSSSKPKSSSKSSHKVKSEPTNHTLTDAEYAQSLSLSLNSHSTRPSSSKPKTSKSSSSKDEKKRKRDRVQSSPTLDSDSDAGGEGKKKKKSKKSKKVKNEDGGADGDGEKKVRGGAFNKEMGLSEALQAVVGGDRMSRPQTVKKIWEYVKERDLQDASDKRFIICDETLQAVFKVPKVHMFTMNKLLSKHIYPLDE